MEFLTSLAASVFLLGCLQLPHAQGLECYVCNTAMEDQKDCNSIPEGSTKFLTNCTQPKNNSCSIQTQWVDFKVLNQTHGTRIIRQCASQPYDSSRPCYYRAGFGGKVNVCYCSGHACNDATNTFASIVTLVISLILTIRLLQ